jgi:hypothetical protein
VSRIFIDTVSYAVDVILIRYELYIVEVKWLAFCITLWKENRPFKLLSYKLRKTFMDVLPCLIEICIHVRTFRPFRHDDVRSIDDCRRLVEEF